MTSRYCYCPMTAKRIGRRVTLAQRFRRWQARRRENKYELFPICDYHRPIYPGK